MEKRFIVAEMPFGTTLSNAVHTKYVLFDNIKKVNLKIEKLDIIKDAVSVGIEVSKIKS